MTNRERLELRLGVLKAIIDREIHNLHIEYEDVSRIDINVHYNIRINEAGQTHRHINVNVTAEYDKVKA